MKLKKTFEKKNKSKRNNKKRKFKSKTNNKKKL